VPDQQVTHRGAWEFPPCHACWCVELVKRSCAVTCHENAVQMRIAATRPFSLLNVNMAGTRPCTAALYSLQNFDQRRACFVSAPTRPKMAPTVESSRATPTSVTSSAALSSAAPDTRIGAPFRRAAAGHRGEQLAQHRVVYNADRHLRPQGVRRCTRSLPVLLLP